MKSFVLLLMCLGGFLGCEEHEFACKLSGECIPVDQKCDGVQHCSHGEDELNCPKVCHDETEFKCIGDGSCIDKIFYCDGFQDCHDGSDEYYCTNIRTHTCNPGHFMCKDSKFCWPEEFRCDGHVDCEGGEDEVDCDDQLLSATIQVKGQGKVEVHADPECPFQDNMIRCEDAERTCIPARHICDGEADCLNGSDELHCGNRTQHHECLPSEGNFACAPSALDLDIQCIRADQVCNGKPQCPKGDDEGDFCALKTCPTFGCEHFCMETPHEGPKCHCEVGYKLAADMKQCEDIDECQIYGSCDQLCHNNKGGFECGCNDGYHLEGNSTCLFTGSATLYIALQNDINSGQIRSYDLHTKEYLEAVSSIDNPVGVAYDYLNGKLIWTDAVLGRSVIEQAKITGHGNVENRELLLQTGLELPEDLAIHEASSLVYFTDSNKGHIAVCSALTAACTVLSHEHNKPRGLAVHQNDNQLFVTEWGSRPGIVKMNLDGSRRETIISTDIVWPNGIAVDETTERIFWTDRSLMRIESATTYGGDRRIVVEDKIQPFGIAVFEDRLYWSDWGDYRVRSCNKFTGNDWKILVTQTNRINGLSLQLSIPSIPSNPCSSSSQCSHICIPSGSTYVCKCPDDLHLDFDDSTCVANKDSDSLLLAVGHSLLALKPQHLGRISLESVAFETSIISGLANVAHNGDLLAHTNTSDIFHINTNHKSSSLVSSETDILSLTYDYKSLNLFWIDQVRKSIFMMSQMSKQVRTLTHCVDPKALIFDESQNAIVFIDGLNLVESTLDGLHNRVLSNAMPADANLLAYSENERSFYVSTNDSILSYEAGRSGLMPVVEEIQRPVSLAIQAGYLYWTQEGSNLLSWISIKRHEVEPTVYQMELDNPGAHAIHLSSMSNEELWGKPCLYAGCSDICIKLTEESTRCLCGDGRMLVKDDKFTECKVDGSADRSSKSKPGNGASPNLYTLVGIMVSLTLVFLSIVILVVVFCCLKQKRPWKSSSEFINRSFGNSISGIMNKEHNEMSPVTISRIGTCNEIENPGFCSVDIGHPESSSERLRYGKNSLLGQVDCDYTEEESEGIVNKLYNKFKSKPKMAAMEWTESAVSYETLENAKGSSTPSSHRRMPTIEERDSAYTDQEASIDSETSINSRTFL